MFLVLLFSELTSTQAISYSIAPVFQTLPTIQSLTLLSALIYILLDPVCNPYISIYVYIDSNCAFRLYIGCAFHLFSRLVCACVHVHCSSFVSLLGT